MIEYKSGRSDKFRVWLKANKDNRDAEEKLIELEKRARLVTHYFSLTGDYRHEDMAALSKIIDTIQEEYENK